MLPGFRFLFAAILLSMSVLVFGLGAAALLRAAHEEFSSNPSWHAPPETMFAQQQDATRPVLTMLRVEPAAVERKAPANIPAIPTATRATNVAAPSEQAPNAPTPADDERIAALRPEAPSPPEAAKPEMPASENSVQTAPPAAQGDAAVAAEAPAPLVDSKVAATEQAPPPVAEAVPLAAKAAPVPPEQTSAPALAVPEVGATKVATLGGPPASIELPPAMAKAAGAKPDKSAIKKRQLAIRAAQRRRAALRSRLAAQQILQQPPQPQQFQPTQQSQQFQQPVGLFAPSAIQPVAPARKR